MSECSSSGGRRKVFAASMIAIALTLSAGAIVWSSLAPRASAGGSETKGPDAPVAAQDKYSVKVPGGLAFSDFRGYEGWQVVAVSHSPTLLAVIVANPQMIAAYQSGIPANRKPFPDGAKMAKIHWVPKGSEKFPNTIVPGVQHDVDFMEKDSKRFADSGGWGYAYFTYDAASSTFGPATLTDKPPQANDAKCGLACHSIAKSRDYVFTEYGTR
jgi:hypothetical protein